MISLAERPEGAWRPPVLKTVASQRRGIDKVVDEIDKHHAWAQESGELTKRRNVARPTRLKRLRWPQFEPGWPISGRMFACSTSQSPLRRDRQIHTPRLINSSRPSTDHQPRLAEGETGERYPSDHGFPTSKPVAEALAIPL